MTMAMSSTLEPSVVNSPRKNSERRGRSPSVAILGEMDVHSPVASGARSPQFLDTAPVPFIFGSASHAPRAAQSMTPFLSADAINPDVFIAFHSALSPPGSPSTSGTKAVEECDTIGGDPLPLEDGGQQVVLLKSILVPEPKLHRAILIASGPFRHACEKRETKKLRDWNEEFQALWEVECRPTWDIESRRQLERLCKEFDELAKELAESLPSPYVAATETQGAANHIGLSTFATPKDYSVHVPPTPNGAGSSMLPGSSRAPSSAPLAAGTSRIPRRSVRPLANFEDCFRYQNVFIRRWKNAEIGKRVQKTFGVLFESRVPQLCFPLTSCHTVMGCAVTVQAMVPVSDSRLVYRADAQADAVVARTVHHQLVRVLEGLNLAPIDRGNQWKQVGVEVVQGSDTRYYVTNALGLLPPLFPHLAPQLSGVFRFEHLTRGGDAVNYMTGAQPERFAEEINDVCHLLPNIFCDRGEDAADADRAATGNARSKQRHQKLIETLHRYGLSVALLGRVLHHWLHGKHQLELLDDAEVQEVVTKSICVEIIARTVKSSLVAKMRAEQAPLDVEHANAYLAQTVASVVYSRSTGLATDSGASASNFSPVHQASTSAAENFDRRATMRLEFDAMCRFEEGLLPLIAQKFDVTGQAETAVLRVTFQTQTVLIVKRLCELLHLTMHRGSVVGLHARPSPWNFALLLSTTREMESSKRLLQEATDKYRSEECMVSYVLPRRAALHCRVGAFSKALVLLRRIASRRARGGSRNILYFDALIDVALLAVAAGDEEAADTLFQRVHEGYDKVLSSLTSGPTSTAAMREAEEHVLVRLRMQLQMYWGHLKLNHDKYREARKRFQDALDLGTLKLSCAGATVPISMQLSCLSGLLEVAARSPVTMDLLSLQPQITLPVMRMRPNRRSFELLLAMGRALIHADHYETASEVLRDAIELARSVFGRVSEEMAMVSNQLAFIYFKWDAKRYGATCVTILKDVAHVAHVVNGMFSVSHLTALHNLVRVFIEIEHFSKASAQLHRLLSLPPKSLRGVPRHHTIFSSLQSAKEQLTKAYQPTAVLILQHAWRAYKEKVALQGVIQDTVLLLQAAGRGFMSRRRRVQTTRTIRLDVSRLGAAASHRSGHMSPSMAAVASFPPQATVSAKIAAGSFLGHSMSQQTHFTANTNIPSGTREDNPYVFGFSSGLLAASRSSDFVRFRDWNGEFQAVMDDIKVVLDPKEYALACRKRQALQEQFRACVLDGLQVIEKTPSKVARVPPGSHTTFRIDNIVFNRFPSDAVTPYAQQEALQRVLGSGYPGITAPLMDVVPAADGSYTYTAVALIPISKSGMEYLRHEDLRSVVLTRKGVMHALFLNKLLEQISTCQASGRNSSMNTSPSRSVLSQNPLHEDASLDSNLRSDTTLQQGIEVLRGIDERWYVTNALGLYGQLVWTLEAFDGVTKTRDDVLTVLPPPRASVFEAARTLIGGARKADALALAEETVVQTQKHLKDIGASETKRSLGLILGTYLKAVVASGCQRHSDSAALFRTAALMLDERDLCSARASEMWLLSGRELWLCENDLDAAAMFTRSYLSAIKIRNHRRMYTTVLNCLIGLLRSHARASEEGNVSLPPLENTVTLLSIRNWIASLRPSEQSLVVAQQTSRWCESRTQLDDAVVFAQEMVRIASHVGGDASIAYARALERLASLHLKRALPDDSERSIACLQKCIGVLRRAAPDSVEMGILHSKLAHQTLAARQSLSAATMHLRAATNLLSMRLPRDHSEMVALRKCAKTIESKLRVGATSRIQRFVRGWIARKSAERDMRVSDPESYAQLIHGRMERARSIVSNAETNRRLGIVDEEFLEFASYERQVVLERERARRAYLKRILQASHDGILAQRRQVLLSDGVVPLEALHRGALVYRASALALCKFADFAAREKVIRVRDYLRLHAHEVQRVRCLQLAHMEEVLRGALWSRVYVQWALQCMQFAEQYFRKSLEKEAHTSKLHIGDLFAQGANDLLGYTALIETRVAALQHLLDSRRFLESSGEPDARSVVECEELVARESLFRAQLSKQEVIVALDRGWLCYPHDPRLSALSPDSALRSASNASPQSLMAMPQVVISAPTRPPSGNATPVLSAGSPSESPATPLMISDGHSPPIAPKPELFWSSVEHTSPHLQELDPGALAVALAVSAPRSPINHDLAPSRGRRSPRHAPDSRRNSASACASAPDDLLAPAVRRRVSLKIDSDHHSPPPAMLKPSGGFVAFADSSSLQTGSVDDATSLDALASALPRLGSSGSRSQIAHLAASGNCLSILTPRDSMISSATLAPGAVASAPEGLRRSSDSSRRSSEGSGGSVPQPPLDKTTSIVSTTSTAAPPHPDEGSATRFRAPRFSFSADSSGTAQHAQLLSSGSSASDHPALAALMPTASQDSRIHGHTPRHTSVSPVQDGCARVASVASVASSPSLPLILVDEPPQDTSSSGTSVVTPCIACVEVALSSFTKPNSETSTPVLTVGTLQQANCALAPSDAAPSSLHAVEAENVSDFMARFAPLRANAQRSPSGDRSDDASESSTMGWSGALLPVDAGPAFTQVVYREASAALRDDRGEPAQLDVAAVLQQHLQRKELKPHTSPTVDDRDHRSPASSAAVSPRNVPDVQFLCETMSSGTFTSTLNHTGSSLMLPPSLHSSPHKTSDVKVALLMKEESVNRSCVTRQEEHLRRAWCSAQTAAYAALITAELLRSSHHDTVTHSGDPTLNSEVPKAPRRPRTSKRTHAPEAAVLQAATPSTAPGRASSGKRLRRRKSLALLEAQATAERVATETAEQTAWAKLTAAFRAGRYRTGWTPASRVVCKSADIAAAGSAATPDLQPQRSSASSTTAATEPRSCGSRTMVSQLKVVLRSVRPTPPTSASAASRHTRQRQ